MIIFLLLCNNKNISPWHNILNDVEYKNLVLKWKVWRCTKSNLVSAKTCWCCTKKYLCHQKKVHVARKSISCWQKQDDAASKKYFVYKKVIVSFSKRRAMQGIWKTVFVMWNIRKLCKPCKLLLTCGKLLANSIY